MQNLVVLMEPYEDAYQISLKGGNMILNRFCIDEDASFELSGVNYLKPSSRNMSNFFTCYYNDYRNYNDYRIESSRYDSFDDCCDKSRRKTLENKKEKGKDTLAVHINF